MSWVLNVCQWIEASAGSTTLRESVWMYPIIESAHVLGMCVFAGLILVWDLRLVGLGITGTRVSAIEQRLMPFVNRAFVFMASTGLLLCYTEPMRFYGNVFFRAKLIMLALAGLNAWLFYRTAEYGRLPQWDAAPMTPRRAKLAGGTSLVLWTLIIIAGRFIAYDWFK